MNKPLRILALPLAVLAAGCTVGPDYYAPRTQAPGRFATTGPTARSSVATTQPVNVARWWRQLKDAELDRLVARAASSNLDLQEASARLREARARRAAVAGGQYPEIDVKTSYTHQRLSKTAEPFAAVANGGIPFEYDLYEAGFDASWELDVFGHQRRSLQAADAMLQAGVEDRRDVLVSVLAEVARNYVELRGYQRQLAVAERNLAVQKQMVEVTIDLQKRGVVRQLDVSRARAQASATAARIPELTNLEWQAIHRLAVLVGQNPDALAGELSPPAEIPVPPAHVAVGLPSELLRRRADIRRAERQLAAATAEIGVATADLFPRFSLNGSFGLQSSEAASFFNYDSREFAFGPAMRWPIFDAGRLKALVKVRNAQQEQALAAYQRTVLTAFEEVEDAIVAVDTEQQRSHDLADSVQANEESADVAQNLYRQGLTDFLTVLEAQRSLYASQDELARSQQAVTANVIALYKALGGGWEFGERPATTQPVAATKGQAKDKQAS